MRTVRWLLATTLAVTWIPILSRSGDVRAQEPNVPARSSRGGLLAESGKHRFEVFFYRTGVRVFAQDPTGRRSTSLASLGRRPSSIPTPRILGSRGRFRTN